MPSTGAEDAEQRHPPQRPLGPRLVDEGQRAHSLDRRCPARRCGGCRCRRAPARPTSCSTCTLAHRHEHEPRDGLGLPRRRGTRSSRARCASLWRQLLEKAQRPVSVKPSPFGRTSPNGPKARGVALVGIGPHLGGRLLAPRSPAKTLDPVPIAAHHPVLPSMEAMRSMASSTSSRWASSPPSGGGDQRPVEPGGADAGDDLVGDPSLLLHRARVRVDDVGESVDPLQQRGAHGCPPRALDDQIVRASPGMSHGWYHPAGRWWSRH